MWYCTVWCCNCMQACLVKHMKGDKHRDQRIECCTNASLACLCCAGSSVLRHWDPILTVILMRSTFPGKARVQGPTPGQWALYARPWAGEANSTFLTSGTGLTWSALQTHLGRHDKFVSSSTRHGGVLVCELVPVCRVVHCCPTELTPTATIVNHCNTSMVVLCC